MCFPALVLLAVAGVQRLASAARFAAVTVLVLLSVWGIRNYFRGMPGEGEEWREITQFVVSNSAPGDGLVFDNGIARPVFDYYGRRAQWPQVLFPSHGPTITYRDFEGIATPAVIRFVRDDRNRIWLIARDPNIALEQAMLEAYSKAEQKAFRGATVQLYVKQPK
jgi:hypothetical protein